MQKSKLLILVGPTAIGKTALSIKIAKEFNAEIISGDSMQVYKGMDIGTGKITAEEMDGVPHHLIDILNPDETFSVSDFQNQVKALVKDIESRNKRVLIAGGTGHYIKALIDGYQFNDEDQEDIERLTHEFEKYSQEELYSKLLKIQPDTDIHPNNKKRIVRQLVKEKLDITEKKAYTQKKEYDTFLVGLSADRSVIYDRINQRVAEMFDSGLLEEVAALQKEGLSKTAAQAIGYKEFLPYFKGEAALTDVMERIQAHSRQYAKRQLTFFRNQLDVHWYDITYASTDIIFRDIYQFLQTKGEN
ncbi:tRNA dimethylallyltransferase [Jeotgalicoccus aerolatus]|uniref:tRNA dimethylallyltransferase n=1 Tax=Jeotgalicoccus aerolatus TaxID=709510 RepID=A0ABS4HKR9_9STAP|nr:tRNA (adenosine(37)-N6)-dimethylallyltransferase MiaA [Jeotgalicoccus aerolatus]MBP1951520.1 tRNA dimethylallyltransferase [Jeotgalicoccus aerolatus]GGD96899.1 tRNA dimethylallyltransferase [Jeotgalicoccus aerolatus]CAD2076268.1 tRNA dimethylallyltransferase [Jeotgalicoccus aerolatus]